MCGIAGFFRLQSLSREEAERRLERMAQTMKRRGPDAQGIFSNGPVGLAHRRLRIIDLSPAGNQPMFNEDGKVGIVFNGEIYNFRELRAELEKCGHVFRSRSDTEVIVHAFEEWGGDSFRRFNGIFAMGIWDGRGAAPELWLARDRFGTKPLYYTTESGGLAFASELKPLMTLPEFPRTLDPQALFYFLKFSHVPSPFSIFEGVRQLAPGTWLRFRAGAELESALFRDPLELAGSRREAGPVHASEAGWLAEAESTLVSSVRRQLVSDVPVGCFLSGGVDSSLLAWAYGQAAEGSAVETYSIGYREKEFDETPFARIAAKAFKTRHHELVVGPADYMDLIPEVPDYFDQPFADPTLLSSLLLARFARQEVTVALSGDGGDELYFGYPHQRALLTLSKLADFPAAPRKRIFEGLGGMIRAASRLGVAGPRAHQLGKLSDMLQFEDAAELFQYFVGTVGPLRMDRLGALLLDRGNAREPLYGPMIEQLRGLPVDERVAQVFIRTFLCDTVLAKTDRATMAYGLEARVPFLDDEMVDLSARLPFEYKLRGGKSKYLLRRLLRQKLEAAGAPAALSHRPKQGFSIPLREWLRGDLKYLLDEYLGRDRLRREGIFHPAEVHGLVREHLASHANHSHLLWSLISFQMWKERYLP